MRRGPANTRRASQFTSLFAVVFQPKVRDQILAHDVAQRVLQLHRLDKQIVLRINARRGIRRLEVEAEPLLNAEPAQAWRACSEIHEEAEIEGQRSRQDRVAA